MAYTLSQAVTEVRSLINEAFASFWSDTEIENWIKEACIDISCKLLSAENEESITLLENRWIYTALLGETWLDDLLKIKGCYYQTVFTPGVTTGLQRIDIEKFGHLQVSSGKPRYFFENNHKFYIYPTPGAAEAGHTIEVIYSYETDDITNLKDEHQPLTFLYAAAKAKAKDRMFQESALYMASYLNSVNFERQDKYDFGVDPTSTFDLK